MKRAELERRVELLAQVPLFDGCPRRQLERAASRAHDLQVPEGTVFTREGDDGDRFFVLADGHADATIGGRVVGTIDRGSFFGEMALLDGRPRVATVTTTTPSRVLALPAREFRRLLAHAPLLARSIMAGIATRLRAVEAASPAAR